jgi:hypothetical protein
MLDLKLLIEKILLESLIRDRLISIYNKTIDVKKEYEKNKIRFKSSREESKKNLNHYILKRIELRYQLGDLLKGKPVLSKGKVLETEEDLDEYIINKDAQFNDLIVLSSRLLPNSQSFTGPL